MKAKVFTLICLVLLGTGLGFAQDKTAEKSIQQSEQVEHLLDGYSLNFTYLNGPTIHMEFYDGKAKYQWISGPSKGNGNKDIPYRSSKIGEDMYLINWHEVDKKDYRTIVFDFEKMTMHSSIIVGYENKPERTLKTVFKSGAVDHLKRGE
ncbi:MoaF-related domain-containing protein [Flavobacterium sp. 7A]|uniref:MoaF-related domain-containing protein n=1 Tax=Flavobacterium sp. 7A TaxID=2940571 RepID=UPI002226D579|nr:hypothetical protein [Flavobacterium sp. 7A]MCW2118073.1 hypothetical protein [Flavobacterium sp. 7A]